MRRWRRRQLERILRDARGELRLPLVQAVAFAFVVTNHSSWRALRDEIGLSQAKTIETTIVGLESGLFELTPTKAGSGRGRARGHG